jgi:transmembrane sensor
MVLDRYLNGSASPADKVALDKWIAENPERAEFLNAVLAKREVETASHPIWDLERIRDRIKDRTTSRPRTIEASATQSFVRSLPQRRSPRTGISVRAMGFAAAVALVVVGGVITWRDFASTHPAVDPPLKLREYVTARGQRASIYLADGSHVTLAPESRLSVPESIGDAASPGQPQAQRNVRLQGGAYFEVARDPMRPFSVTTSAGVALDIGTKFEVRAYEVGRPMNVTVISGVVALHAASTNAPILATLQRGDRGTLSTTGRVHVARNIDLRPVLAWTEGSLIFDRTPVSEVVRELSRWYDLDIQLGKGVDPDRRLVLTLDNESAPDALNLIGLTLGLDVEQQGRRVMLNTQ